jgi:GDP-D-mannose dehydratase
MKLIVGNTSQISKYFTNDYIKISSRNIPSEVFNQIYEEVHLVFGLNFKGLKESSYNEINYYYTLDLIKEFLKISDKIVIYSTCEIWSNCWGGVDLKTPFNFHEEPYILSKFKIVEKIKSINNKKVITVYPFNFNSTYRDTNFLFGKIFNSVLNEEHIEIGDTYYYRDLLHTSYVASICQNVSEDKIIGSGRMFFVNDFIRVLYNKFGLQYDDYVTESFSKYKTIPKNEYYLKSQNNLYTYNNLLTDTLFDFNKLKNKTNGK